MTSVEISIRSIAGDTKVLHVPVDISVRELKQRRELFGVPRFLVSLVADDVVLLDQCKLCDLQKPIDLSMYKLPYDCGLVLGRSLLASVERGEPISVEEILTRPAFPDRPDGAGRTPLIIAAEMAHCDIIRLLLEAEADVERISSRGQTPLYLAVKSGSVNAVRLLLDAGADCERGCRRVPKSAVTSARQEVVSPLDLAREIAEESRNEISQHREEVLKLLLEAQGKRQSTIEQHLNRPAAHHITDLTRAF